MSWQSVRLSNNLQQHVLKSPTKSGDDRPEQDQVALEHLKQEMVERLRRESAVQLAEHKRLLDQQYVPKTTRIASALKACVQQPSSQAHFLPQPRKWANAGDAILSGKYTFHDYESGDPSAIIAIANVLNHSLTRLKNGTFASQAFSSPPSSRLSRHTSRWRSA